MSPRTRRTAAAVGSLAAVVLLLVDLAIVPVKETRAPDAQAAPAAPQASSPLRPEQAYAAIAERPIFQPSRRPAEPLPPKPAAIVAAKAAVPPVSPPPPPPPQPVLAPVTLLAIAISHDKREAVLGFPNGKSSTLAEGESWDGWTLTRVMPDRIVFRQADTETEVTFPVGQQAGRRAAAPAARNPTPPVQRRP